MTSENAPLELRVLVIGGDPVLRRGVVQFIRLIKSSVTVVEASSHSDAYEITHTSEWDIIVLELEDASELVVLRRLKQLQPDIPVLVLTPAVTPASVTAALNAGASGCLSKSSAVREWTVAIETVASGGTYPGVRL